MDFLDFSLHVALKIYDSPIKKNISGKISLHPGFCFVGLFLGNIPFNYGVCNETRRSNERILKRV